uniref:Dilute domain-containing protein n=2 Tax=Populus trichocarpa TaxID=3694 RepID=A0A3N7H872_POPTR
MYMLKESVDAPIKCAEQNPGFSQGKPVGAFTIYRCLVHWRLFEAERTSVFDCLIQMIGSAIENQDDINHMAYWLSNTSMLLFLLQRTLKGSGANPNLPPPPTSFLGMMAKVSVHRLLRPILKLVKIYSWSRLSIQLCFLNNS